MTIDSTRKAPGAATLTDAESVSLMKSHVAYTGKYDVDPDDRVLYARVDGNKLTLKSPALVVGTSGVKSVTQIEYVKAE